MVNVSIPVQMLIIVVVAATNVFREVVKQDNVLVFLPKVLSSAQAKWYKSILGLEFPISDGFYAINAVFTVQVHQPSIADATKKAQPSQL